MQPIQKLMGIFWKPEESVHNAWEMVGHGILRRQVADLLKHSLWLSQVPPIASAIVMNLMAQESEPHLPSGL